MIGETHRYFEARRRFMFDGMDIEPGDVLDLAEFDMPSGRGQMMEAARRGVFVSLTDVKYVRHRVFRSEDRPAPADDDGLPVDEWTDETCRALTIKNRRALLASHGLVQRGSKDQQVARMLAHRETKEAANVG